MGEAIEGDLRLVCRFMVESTQEIRRLLQDGGKVGDIMGGEAMLKVLTRRFEEAGAAPLEFAGLILLACRTMAHHLTEEEIETLYDCYHKSYDLSHARFLTDWDRPYIPLFGEIDLSSVRLAKCFAERLAWKFWDKPAIVILINSPGGDVDASLEFIAEMAQLKRICDGLTIATHCIGQAKSMGLFLLAAGDTGKRSAEPDSKLMNHQISVDLEGKYSTTENEQQLAKHNGVVFKVQEHYKRFGVQFRDLEGSKFTMFKIKDLKMTAIEARDRGYIDEIKEFRHGG